MTDIQRVRAAWTGGSGGDGVSTFYGTDGMTLSVSVHAFFTHLASGLPNEITITLEPEGDVIEDTTGVLTGAWSRSPLAAITGTFAGSYAASSGLVMNWLTGVIEDGRRVRGKTFLVPLNPANFNGSGGVETATVTLLNEWGTELIEDVTNNFKIWHRPTSSHVGSSPSVTAASLSPKAAVLRSRRD